MAQKTIILTDVRVDTLNLLKNEDGIWFVRARYDVLDDNGRVRGGDWVEMEPAAVGQQVLQAVSDLLVEEVKAREGM